MISQQLRSIEGISLHLPYVLLVPLQADFPVLNIPSHTGQGCSAAPPLFLHQGEAAVHRPADGGGAGDAIEHVVRFFFSQMVDQQNGNTVAVGKLFQRGEVPVVIGVSVVVIRTPDHLQGVDDDDGRIRVLAQELLQLLQAARPPNSGSPCRSGH